jgi:hypothetical protein
MLHHPPQAVHHHLDVVVRAVRPEPGAADLGIDRGHPARVEIVGRGARELVLVHERRAEGARQREVLLLQGIVRLSVVIHARLQPPAAAAGVEIDQRIDVVQDVGGDRRRDHLRRIAARVAGIDLVEVGAAVLLGRLAAEAGGRHRIGDGDQDDPALQPRGIERTKALADCDGREELVAVRIGDDAEGRARRAAGDDVQRQREHRAVQHRRDVEPPEGAAFLLAGPQWRAFLRHRTSFHGTTDEHGYTQIVKRGAGFLSAFICVHLRSVSSSLFSR